MSVTNLNLHFPTVDLFAAWLATRPRPRWSPIGSTYHNTYRPTRDQWRGRASMASMADGYAAKGWSTGPHLFLATGTTHDGIFVMCPPEQPAIHGVACNATHFGIENVGDYHATPMDEPQLGLLVATLAVLHRWAGLGPVVNAHRDCVARTCPGDAAYAQKAAIIARLADALATAPARVTRESPILARATVPLMTILSRFPKPTRHYDAPTVDTILASYDDQATALGIDPLIAIAQMAHETGALTSWWSARPRRNPAGIGVNGLEQRDQPTLGAAWAYDDTTKRWRAGLSFASWEDHAIPAHLGRLLAYALTDAQASEVQRTVIRVALAARPLPASFRGSAPTLAGLNGRWAVGASYADGIARWANRLAGM